MNNSIFRKASLDKISSPEQLNDYIKVSNPSIWMVLTAIFILLASVVVWSVTGSLPTSISTSGVAKNGEIVCYLNQEEAAGIKAGMAVKVNDELGRIKSVSDTPLSEKEISDVITDDYTIHALALSQWNFKVNISVDGNVVNNKIYSNISIVTEEVRPIDFLLN